MMSSNQFVFLDQGGVSNSHQQSPNIQQAFMQSEHYPPFQPHLLHQSLTKPVHSPSPPHHQPTQQYSTQSPASSQSIMAPPAQSGINSQFFSQVGHQNQQQQHHFQQQQQFHYPQMNNMNGHSRMMHPVQNGSSGFQSKPMNQGFLSSLLTSSKNSNQEQFRTNLPVSTSSPNTFIPDEFRQIPQLFRQSPSSNASTAIPGEFRQIPDELRQAHKPTPTHVIPDEFRQIPKPPRLIPNNAIHNEFRQVPAPKVVIPDEFRQAPIQTFGEQLEQANVVVSGLIENIQEMIENNEDPKVSSSDLNGDKGNASSDSIVEMNNEKNDNGDIDDLVDELLKDVEEMDNSFVADNSKDKTIEIDDSMEVEKHDTCGSISDIAGVENSPNHVEELSSDPLTLQDPVSSPSHTAVIESSPIPAIEPVHSPIIAKSHDRSIASSPDHVIEENHGDQLIDTSPVSASSPKPVVEESMNHVHEETPNHVNEESLNHVHEETPNPVDEGSPNPVIEPSPNTSFDGTSNPEIEKSPDSSIENSPNTETDPEIDTPMEENHELDIKPSIQLNIRKDIFFSDAVDFKQQKNLIGMECAEREALVAALNLPKEMMKSPTPPPNMSPFLEEELKSGSESRNSSFGNDQLDEIFRTQLSTPPQFVRGFGFPNMSLPSNIPPILGSILTQQQSAGRNFNFSPMSQQSTNNQFSMTNPSLHYNYLNQSGLTESRPSFHSPINFRHIQAKPSNFQENPGPLQVKPKPKASFGDLPLPAPRKRYCGSQNEDREPLYVDPTLPNGWSRSVSQRKTGASAGSWDTYIHAPNGKRFRSRMEIKRHFEKTGETAYNWQDFDFNPFGSKGQLLPEKAETSLMGGSAVTDEYNIMTNNFSQDQSAQQEELDTSSDNFEMEPDIEAFLSCELGTN